MTRPVSTRSVQPTDLGSSLLLTLPEGKRELGVPDAYKDRDAEIVQSIAEAHEMVSQVLGVSTMTRDHVDHFDAFHPLMELSQWGVDHSSVVVSYRDRGLVERVVPDTDYVIERVGRRSVVHVTEAPTDVTDVLTAPVIVSYTAGGANSFNHPNGVKRAIMVVLRHDQEDTGDSPVHPDLVKSIRRICQSELNYGR